MADSVARRPHTATSVRGLVSPPSPILPSSHSSSGAAFHCCFVCLFFSFFFFFSLLSSSHFLHFPTPRLDDSCHHSTSILRSSSLVFFPLVTPFIDVPVPPPPDSPVSSSSPPSVSSLRPCWTVLLHGSPVLLLSCCAAGVPLSLVLVMKIQWGGRGSGGQTHVQHLVFITDRSGNVSKHVPLW